MPESVRPDSKRDQVIDPESRHGCLQFEFVAVVQKREVEKAPQSPEDGSRLYGAGIE
jgi:hypothetical protein